MLNKERPLLVENVPSSSPTLQCQQQGFKVLMGRAWVLLLSRARGEEEAGPEGLWEAGRASPGPSFSAGGHTTDKAGQGRQGIWLYLNGSRQLGGWVAGVTQTPGAGDHY